MVLDQWQEKIDDHFKLLHDFRIETPNKNPVFAIEHGLNNSELDCLKADIRAHIATHEPSNRHWLPWVVYAAEIGYIYDGQEYWQTFELSTTGWTRFRDRNRSWIRECFFRFRDEFHGAEPFGPWAGHFTNICWPIRHAILPHYLQHQLAKALFDMRLFFRSELFESPLLIGNFIATHCRTGTRRFRELLEDPMLVGQLSIALLLQGHKISEDLLLKETQVRIVADLGREQMEREWLESAQRHAVKTYEGLHRRVAAKIGHDHHEKIAAPVAECLRIENTPKLFLYPKANGKEWGIKLELQDLRSLVARFRALEPVIARSCCTVAGTDGYLFPRGMFLRPGPHSFALIRWPSDTEVLITFENAPSELNSFLRMDQLISSGNIHLFKFATEKIGYEVYEKLLRPSQKYVVVSRSPIKHDGVIFKPFDLKCEGVYSALIEMPEEVTLHLEEAVKAVGLRCAKSLRVWPIGLPAKEWDEEGYGVWLRGDHIQVAVRADYELRGIQVVVNRDSPSFFDAAASKNEAILLDLSPLPLGKNLIEIKAFAKNHASENLVGYLSAIVREPQVWDITTANQGSLRGFVDPENPSLEEIWANDVNIEIFGPAGRAVKFRFRLLDRTGTYVILEKQISDLKLPIYGEHWRNVFSTEVKDDTSMQEAYDEAHVGELIFDAEEIGYFTVVSERKFTPIRWTVRKKGNHRKLQYINETETESVNISRFEFAIPDVPVRIEKIGPERTVECTNGGLFLIQGIEDSSDSIITSPYGRKLTIQDMYISPQLKKSYEREEGVLQLVTLYSLWERARTSGNILSELWRKQVLKSITSTLCSGFGGSLWMKAEYGYLVNENDANLRGLRYCISDKPEDRYIGAVLYRDAKRLAGLPIIDRKIALGRLLETQIRNLVKKYHIDHTGKGGIVVRKSPTDILLELALRLSSAPNTVSDWEKEKFSTLLEYLYEVPVILRAGRFMVLAVTSRYDSKQDLSCCYNGWKWQ